MKAIYETKKKRHTSRSTYTYYKTINGIKWRIESGFHGIYNKPDQSPHGYITWKSYEKRIDNNWIFIHAVREDNK